MSKDATRIEIITGRERRRRYSAEQKFALVEETMQPGMTVSAVARLHGVSPSLLFKWRQLMSLGGRAAVRADEDVVAASRLRELEQRVRELERLLGRKTLEIEVLKEALSVAREKKPVWQLPSPPRCEIAPNSDPSWRDRILLISCMNSQIGWGHFLREI